ncbi:MAG: phenylacetate-CoA oxygenase subunit PaaC [Ferruginibacter sp.]|nr:phenylacetate-CoA oxygenase subunit PaaC [Ferruginibacter sp.]
MKTVNLSTYQLTNYLLYLADTNLVLSQRNAEWCGHGPILEQDIAITNISLDLLGQARNFYQYAAVLINQSTNQRAGSEATEDSLAYLRTEREFKNLLITELPRGDWAQTILRQFFCSVYLYLLYEQLQKSKDDQLAAIAGKSIKELTYHIKWSGEWVIRLGDGTDESRQRMLKAIENLWPYTGEFFIPAEFENEAVTGVDLSSLKQPWLQKINTVLEEAVVWSPAFGDGWGEAVFMQTGGKQGIHTEHMGFILAEMQYLQRTYPGAEW